MKPIVHERRGAHWEKRGNTRWLGCPACGQAFPVSPRMFEPHQPACCCPHCHHEFDPAAASGAPLRGDQR